MAHLDDGGGHVAEVQPAARVIQVVAHILTHSSTRVKNAQQAKGTQRGAPDGGAGTARTAGATLLVSETEQAWSKGESIALLRPAARSHHPRRRT